MPRHTRRWRTLPRTPGNSCESWRDFSTERGWGSAGAEPKTDHSLVRILSVVGDVEQVCVLQLFTEPLQQRQRLVESHGHGNPGQVFANVVVQDGHDADVAVVCSWGGEGGAAAWKTTPSSVKRNKIKKDQPAQRKQVVIWRWRNVNDLCS